MPIETPHEISSRTPPSSFHSGCFFLLRFRVPNRRFQSALRHVVSTCVPEHFPNVARRREFPAPNLRPEKIAQHMPRRLDCFRRIVWLFPRNTFAPAAHPVRLNFHEQNPPIRGRAKTRLESHHHRHANFPQRHFLYAHPFTSIRSAHCFGRAGIQSLCANFGFCQG